jgi:cytochrome c oxidase cbb3-type subunit 3
MRRFDPSVIAKARRGALGGLTTVGVSLLFATGVAAQDPEAPSDHDLERGRIHYIASCARCHGVQGGGGEGPPLARARLPRAPDDATLTRLVADGIPGTAMSETWWLSEAEVQQLVAFVRSLGRTTPGSESLSGDPARGRSLYERARCSRCHTIGGFGTSRGPDLTLVGLRRGADYLREAILDPAAALPRGLTAMPSDFSDYLMVRVVDSDGTEFNGMRVNEYSYSIQLRDGRGNVRSFYKPALREVQKQFDRSLMRSYREAFTDDEIDDLVVYLMSLTVERRGVS